MKWRRVLIVWLALMSAEFIHGTLRTILLTPLVGDWRGRQLAVFSGSLIILAIACLFIRWIDLRSTRELLLAGLIWLALTLLFEVGLGRLAFGLSWERIGSDYDLTRGGLLPFGMLLLTLSPLLAARLRRAGESPKAAMQKT